MTEGGGRGMGDMGGGGGDWAMDTGQLSGPLQLFFSLSLLLFMVFTLYMQDILNFLPMILRNFWSYERLDSVPFDSY